MKLILATGSMAYFSEQAFIEQWALIEDFEAAAKRGRSYRQSLAVRALLRSMLYQNTGTNDWLLSADANGKPVLFSANNKIPAPSLSLSHCRDGIAVLLGPPGLALGVDIEAHKFRNFNSLADYAFGPNECAIVRKGGKNAFYRLWTLREAMGKANGLGLSLAADGQDHVGNSGNNADFWRVQSHLTGIEWFLAHIRPSADHSLSIAAQITSQAKVKLSLHYTY